jgi:hypothetical protein
MKMKTVVTFAMLTPPPVCFAYTERSAGAVILKADG